MKKDPYVNNQIGIVVDYLDNNPESLITITPDIKSIFQNRKSVADTTESYFEYAMNSGWEFFKNTLPAVGKVGSTFVGTGVFRAMFHLYAYHDYDKNRLRTGLLQNGLLEQICKLDSQKILHLYDLAVAAGVVKEKDRDVFSKTMDLLKDLTSEEKEKVSHHLIDYMDKQKLYTKDKNELLKLRIGLLGAVSGYIKSPKQVIKLQEISELFLKTHQKNKPDDSLNLSSNAIKKATELSPQISQVFKYTEQIKKLITLYEDYNMALEIKNEFIEASKEILKDQSFIKKAELAILQTIKKTNPNHDKVIRQKIYNATLDLMESIAPDIKEINTRIKEDRSGFEIAVDDLLKDNSSAVQFKKVKSLDLDGKKIVEFLEKITSPGGNKAITRYLDKPTTINFGRIFTEGGLVKWAAGRAIAMCNNSSVIHDLKKSMVNTQKKVKSVVPSARRSRSM